MTIAPIGFITLLKMNFPQIAPRGSATTRVGSPDLVISSPSHATDSTLPRAGPSHESSP